MIGGQLTRFQLNRRFMVMDTEAEDLNLATSRPWELSYAIATLKDGIINRHCHYIDIPDLRMSEGAIRVTRFDRAKYDSLKRPAHEVWAEVGPILYSHDHYVVGHNLAGYDIYVINNLRRMLGLPYDDSWVFRMYDTFPLSKAYLKRWTPDISSASAFLAFQYRVLDYRDRSIKTSLGAMANQLSVPYDVSQAHAASYDVDINWGVFRELVFKMEI